MVRNYYTILGLPFNGIGVSPAEENPAQAIRDAGLVELLRSRGATVEDAGDLEIPSFSGIRDESTHVLNQAEWIETSIRLADRLGEVIEKESMPLVLGGDCGILIGIIGAFVQREIRVGLVSLDGHTDFRSPESSPSGEAADLPLWVLTGRGPAALSGLFGRTPMIRDTETAVFGYREPDMIDQSSIIRCDRNLMAEIGIAAAAERGLRPLLDQGLELWFHFDVDVIDPRDMPAVHFPEAGGLSFDETSDFIRCVCNTGRLAGVSMSCYHNNCDEGGIAAGKLVRLLTDVLN